MNGEGEPVEVPQESGESEAKVNLPKAAPQPKKRKEVKKMPKAKARRPCVKDIVRHKPDTRQPVVLEKHVIVALRKIQGEIQAKTGARASTSAAVESLLKRK